MVSENEVDFMVQSHRKSQGSSCISDRRLIVATPVQDIMKVFQHIARRESSHRVEVSLKVQLFDERLRGSPGSPGSPVLLGEDKRLMAQSGTKVSAISDQRMFQMYPYPNVSKCIQMYPNVQMSIVAAVIFWSRISASPSKSCIQPALGLAHQKASKSLRP